jgi:hypothetical protein
LPASLFIVGIPGIENGAHYIFRTDVQLNRNNSIAARFNHADTGTENSGGGGLNTLERRIDLGAVDNSFGVQLASFTSKAMNEFRFQFAGNRAFEVRNQISGAPPGIMITSVANFGSPQDTDFTNNTNFTQIQNNFAWTRDQHAFEVGGGSLFRYALSRSALSTVYTFPSIDSYRDARNGIEPIRLFSVSRDLRRPRNAV